MNKKVIYILIILVTIVSIGLLVGCKPCDHIAGEWKVATKQTCSSTGIKTQSCTKCKVVLDSKTLSSLTHIPGDWVISEQPTCSYEGSKERYCKLCEGRIYSESINRVPHRFDYDNAVILREADCTLEKCIKITCLNCGISKQEYVGMPLGHEPSDWQGELPTCLDMGKQIKVCTLCDIQLESQYLPALGHVQGERKIIRSPDCTNDGYYSISCEKCNAISNWTIPALGHNYEEWQNSTPKCTKSIRKDRQCNTCKYKEYEEVNHLGGHTDINADNSCDHCKDELFRIKLSVDAECNSSAQVDEFMLMGKESGSIIKISLGDNSIYQSLYRIYSSKKAKYSIDYIEKDLLYTLTTEYYQYLDYFEDLQEIVILVYDTNITSFAVVQPWNKDGENSDYYVYLFRGKSIDPDDHDAMNDPKNKVTILLHETSMHKNFLYFVDMRNNKILTDNPSTVILTDSFNYFRAYYDNTESI